jgi:hypothetical protein
MMADRWKAPAADDLRQAVTDALSDLEAMKREITSATRDSHTPGARILRADYWGTLGATRKRLAEVQFLTEQGDWRATLRAALKDYWEGLQQGAKTDHWVLGQYVVLRSVLQETPKPGVLPQGDEPWVKSWVSVRIALENFDRNERMWARSSIADLLMVGEAEGWRIPPEVGAVGPAGVVAQLEMMVEEGNGPTECRALWPTFRQFWRWRYWWENPKWSDAAQGGFEYLWALVRPRLGLDPPRTSNADPIQPRVTGTHQRSRRDADKPGGLAE